MNQTALIQSHGTATQRGTHVCASCGFAIPAERLDELPDCPNCGDSHFQPTRSLFLPPEPIRHRDDTDVNAAWIAEARATAQAGMPSVAYQDAEAVHVLPLDTPCIRIGRSALSEIRLEDPTVSRRHAMIGLDDDGTITLYDDRSLNGVFVNGERVEHSELADGDEILVGRFHMVLIAR